MFPAVLLVGFGEEPGGEETQTQKQTDPNDEKEMLMVQPTQSQPQQHMGGL